MLALGVARDWLPLAVILLAYREMGWFALPHQIDQIDLGGGHKFQDRDDTAVRGSARTKSCSSRMT
jgi:hypothetical protein